MGQRERERRARETGHEKTHVENRGKRVEAVELHIKFPRACELFTSFELVRLDV